MYNQPMLTKKWNYNNFAPRLHSYLRCSERFLDVFFLLLAVILSDFHENPRRKDWLQQKVHERICARDIIFFGCTPSFLYHFLLPFSSAPSISSDLILRTKSFAPEKVPPLPPVSTTHSIKDFFSKCDQIHRKLRIWSHLLKKSVMENFIFLCGVSED